MFRKSIVPQSKNKCNCIKSCSCYKGNMKSNPDNLIRENHRPASSTSSSSNPMSEDAYTEWRQIYERSSSQLSNYYTKAEDLQFEELPAKFMFMKDQELVALREFRLQNSNECFSEDSILPLVQKIERHNHTCEYSYKINDRGLLEPRLQTNDGRDICRICKKSSDFPTTFKVGLGKKTIPIIPGLKGANGKIVIDDDKAKDMGKTNYLPRSRLALNHKKRSK
ncbi:hypothetical protein ACFFRR_000313 [Megaselia abdita]